MSVSRLIVILLVIVAIVAAAVTVAAVGLKATDDSVAQAQERRFLSDRLAEELLQSSELLTRFARAYTATGDARFRRYFEQSLDIRDGRLTLPLGYESGYWDRVATGDVEAPTSVEGARSLEQRLIDVGITIEEYALLKNAKVESDQLARIEAAAMKTVDERDDGEARARATATLYDADYLAAKARIMGPIGQFRDLIEKRTARELGSINAWAEFLMWFLIANSVLMLATFSGLALILYRRFIAPGRQIVEVAGRIAAGDLLTRSGITGSDEIGRLGQSIDGMADSLSAALETARMQTANAEARAAELDEERDRSEKLLENMLPVLIADRLKRGESTIAETFPEVTVLFADIVGFTEMATRISPQQLVNMLSDVFGRFDELAARHKLEKIKTIGDCYMVVGGVPDRSPTHCQQVAEFAVEALVAIAESAAVSGLDLRLRIGMHTGTVVAGIVGLRKYSYDLWGDVVNLASRIQGVAEPNGIQVTDAVRVRLQDDYLFGDPIAVDLKGRGTVTSYALRGRKAN
jgi:adenylate cyclase